MYIIKTTNISVLIVKNQCLISLNQYTMSTFQTYLYHHSHTPNDFLDILWTLSNILCWLQDIYSKNQCFKTQTEYETQSVHVNNKEINIQKADWVNCDKWVAACRISKTRVLLSQLPMWHSNQICFLKINDVWYIHVHWK